MANLGFNFDQKEYDDYEDLKFVVLPKGDYKAFIGNSDVKQNKKRTGMLLVLDFAIISDNPNYEGVVIKEFLNIQHTNKTAENIGRQKLATIQRKAGFMETLVDSAQLHGRPIILKLDIEKDNEGKERNKIAGYKSKTETQDIKKPDVLW